MARFSRRVSNLAEIEAIVNEIVPGKYVAFEEVESGAQGVAVIATNQKLDRREFLKLIEGNSQEARTIARLNHPNLPTVYDTLERDEVSLIAIEFLEGDTLEDRIKEGMSRSEIRATTQNLCSAVEHIHSEGLCHGDIKGKNIVMTPKGPKLIDYGLSGATFSGGTDTTMDPVVYLNSSENEPGDKQSDIFSLAAVILQMYTGETPFEYLEKQGTEKIHIMQRLQEGVTVLPAATRPIDKVLQRALAPKEQRYQTIQEFARDISSSHTKKRLKWVSLSAVAAAALSIGGFLGVTSVLEAREEQRLAQQEQQRQEQERQAYLASYDSTLDAIAATDSTDYAALDILLVELGQKLAEQKIGSYAEEFVEGGNFPQLTVPEGSWQTVPGWNWQAQFFPDILHTSYLLTNDEKFLTWSMQATDNIAFVGNENQLPLAWKVLQPRVNMRLYRNPDQDNSIIVQAADYMFTQYDENSGVFFSDTQRCEETTVASPLLDGPLGLMWEATDITGDTKYARAAMTNGQNIITFNLDERGRVQRYACVSNNQLISRQEQRVFEEGQALSSAQARFIRGSIEAYVATGEDIFKQAAEDAANFYADYIEAQGSFVPLHILGEQEHGPNTTAGALAAQAFFTLYDITQDERYKTIAYNTMLELTEHIPRSTQNHAAILDNYCFDAPGERYCPSGFIMGDATFLKVIEKLKEN